MSQPPICDEFENVRTIICFAYPKRNFKDKTTLIAATFFVAEVVGVAAEKSCLAGPSRNTDGTRNAKINGIKFKVFDVSENWTSAGQVGDIYRVFHAKKCYELSVQIANSSIGAFDPGSIKEFSKKDWDEVRGFLMQPVNSFTLLK